MSRLLALARLAVLAAAAAQDDACLFQSRVQTHGTGAGTSLAGDADATEEAAAARSEQAAELIDVSTLLSHPVPDDGRMHLAVASCAVCSLCTKCTRLDGMLQTLLAQAKLEGGRKPVLHHFVDKPCAEHVRSFDKRTLESMKHRLYDINTVPGPVVGTEYHGKPCTMVRLYLPRLFPKLRKLLYLDQDVLVLNSLRPIYELAVPAFAMGEDLSTAPPTSPKLYCPHWQNGTVHLINNSQGLMTCVYGDYGTNAGVLLFNLEGWRQMGLDTDVDLWVNRIISGELVARFYDQAILNLVALEHPDSATVLPCEANVAFSTRWMCFFHEGSWKAFLRVLPGQVLQRNNRRPIVLHDKFGDGAKAQHWRFLREQALHFADLVHAGRLRNASNLCDVFRCDRLILEASWECECNRGNFGCDDCGERTYYVESTQYPHVY